MSSPVAVTGSTKTTVSSANNMPSCAGVNAARSIVEPSHNSVTVPPIATTLPASRSRSGLAASTRFHSRAPTSAPASRKARASASTFQALGIAPSQRTHGSARTAAIARASPRTTRQLAGRKCSACAPAATSAARYSGSTWVWNCTTCNRVPAGATSAPSYDGRPRSGSNWPITRRSWSSGAASGVQALAPARRQAAASAVRRTVRSPTWKTSSPAVADARSDVGRALASPWAASAGRRLNTAELRIAAGDCMGCSRWCYDCKASGGAPEAQGVASEYRSRGRDRNSRRTEKPGASPRACGVTASTTRRRCRGHGPCARPLACTHNHDRGNGWAAAPPQPRADNSSYMPESAVAAIPRRRGGRQRPPAAVTATARALRSRAPRPDRRGPRATTRDRRRRRCRPG